MSKPNQKSSAETDAERLEAGAARLRELLQNPGPGITITPVATPRGRGEQTDDVDEKIALPESTATDAAPTRDAADQPLAADTEKSNDDAAQAVATAASASSSAAPPAAKPPAPDTTLAQPHPTTHISRVGRAIAAQHEKWSRKLAAAAPPSPVPARTPDVAPTKANTTPSNETELGAAITANRDAFVATGLFSLVINILMLAGPLFMLQVYDRVMASGSMSTLVALFAMTAGLYGIIGMLELARSRIVTRIGVDVDARVGDRVFQAALKHSLVTGSKSGAALRELDTLRQFLASPGPLTFFDAPWTPIYLLVIFLMHWMLGVAAIIGAIMLLMIAWASEARSREPMQEAGKAAAHSIELAETGQRNAEAITAMGMLSAYRNRWQSHNRQTLAWQVLAADRLGSMTALSKALRLLLQSAMLAIGAALAVNGEISAGTIVAATIIFGRALAPVEQAIGHWRNFLKARNSYATLNELLEAAPAPPERTDLPKPKGNVSVQNLRVGTPDTGKPILANVTFDVAPGQMLAVIGPSASGKSTLARALVGLWQPQAGTVRLDGARLDQWDGEALGQHIGYLPQNVDLFAGSVRDNIARFQEGGSDGAVVTAAKRAHAHELILGLPGGYETELGSYGTYLSGGQRQRIALARALFGDPALVVLDEPNANLDRIGDDALAMAIDGMRERGQAVILISHRVQAISKADLLLYIDRGLQRAFGPRDEVMRAFAPSADAASDGSPKPARAHPNKPGRSTKPTNTVAQDDPKRAGDPA